VAKVTAGSVQAKAEAMIGSIRSVLAENDAGSYPMSPTSRHRYEGALVALEALLGKAPSLLGERGDSFIL
jgi:hypothetical protein